MKHSINYIPASYLLKMINVYELILCPCYFFKKTLTEIERNTKITHTATCSKTSSWTLALFYKFLMFYLKPEYRNCFIKCEFQKYEIVTVIGRMSTAQIKCTCGSWFQLAVLWWMKSEFKLFFLTDCMKVKQWCLMSSATGVTELLVKPLKYLKTQLYFVTIAVDLV